MEAIVGGFTGPELLSKKMNESKQGSAGIQLETDVYWSKRQKITGLIKRVNKSLPIDDGRKNKCLEAC